ncbi:multicopper oxidase domain-containing protein [Streptomyces caeni]|uniref:Multicopper oxidase domain-containing protein n=1 Tax=Streptomyces caeni TaxID=2307231 RepID=A0ABW4IP13_9ACTN
MPASGPGRGAASGPGDGRVQRGPHQDTANVAPRRRTVIRVRFTDRTGKTVLRCHSLNREDKGMTAVQEIVGQPRFPPARISARRLPRTGRSCRLAAARRACDRSPQRTAACGSHRPKRRVPIFAAAYAAALHHSCTAARARRFLRRAKGERPRAGISLAGLSPTRAYCDGKASRFRGQSVAFILFPIPDVPGTTAVCGE